MYAVCPDASAGLRIFKVAEVLHLVGDEIKTVDVSDVRVLDPDLVIDRSAFDRDMAELATIGIPFFGRTPHLELLGLLIKLRYGALIHHADPRIVILVEFEIERAFGPSRLDYRNWILRHLAGLGVHF